MTQIKILEFYPILLKLDKQEVKGTISIDWIDKNIRLRCVHVYQKQEDLYVFTPSQKMISHVDGKLVHVPVIDFNDDEEKQAVTEMIKAQWPEFLQKWLIKPINQPRDYFLANKEKWKKKPFKRGKKPFKKNFKKPFRPGGCAPGSNKFSTRG